MKGDGLEQQEGAAALELLEAPASGNIDPGQRQQWPQEPVAERCADLVEEDHRRVREASLRSGESLSMRFRCEPSLPMDVTGAWPSISWHEIRMTPSRTLLFE